MEVFVQGLSAPLLHYHPSYQNLRAAFGVLFGSRPERPVPTAQPSPRQPAIYPVMPLGATNAGAWQTGGRCQLELTVGTEMKEPGWQKRTDRIETCRVTLCV